MLRALGDLDVSELYDRFGALSPQVFRLGCAVATWPYIPYAVLRRCRRLFAPIPPTYIEAELCRSSLVDGSAADGFSLERSFRCAALSLLRSRLSDGALDLGADLHCLRGVLSERYVALSPLLEVEAELAWDYLFLDGDAFATRVNERLHDVLLSAVLEKRDGILSWVAGASARLPPECIQGEVAWLLYQLCQARKIEMAPVPTPRTHSPGGLLALVSERLPTVVAGIERTPGFIELGPPSPERAVGIVLVETDPFIVSVEDRLLGTGPRNMLLKRGEVSRIPCSNGEVVLGNLLGQTFTLAPMTGEQSVEAQAADRAIARAVEAQAQRTRLAATVIRPVEAGYVVSLNEIGATAFLFSPQQELREGDALAVRVDRVYLEKRWISAQLVTAPTPSDFQDRSAVTQVPAHKLPETLSPGDTFRATVVHRGMLRGSGPNSGRTAYVQVDPRSLLGDVNVVHTRRRWPGLLRFPRAIRKREGGWYPPTGAEVEVVVAGLVEDSWQLRLRSRPSEEPAEPAEPRVQLNERISATVLVVEPDGVELEAGNGQLLWLPRTEVVPNPAPGAPIPMRVGEVVRVCVRGVARGRSNRLFVNQRGLKEPYLHRLHEGRRVVGQVVRRLRDGELLLRLDPILNVSSSPFLAQTTGCKGRSLPLGTRVRANVVGLMQGAFWLFVNNVRPGR